jgi:hypothetical protein
MTLAIAIVIIFFALNALSAIDWHSSSIGAQPSIGVLPSTGIALESG